MIHTANFFGNFNIFKWIPISLIVISPDLRGWVLDEFDVTIPLPTYLVAMITTDFKFRKIKDGNLELRVCFIQIKCKQLVLQANKLYLDLLHSYMPQST